MPYTGADIAAGLLVAALLISVGTIFVRQARARPGMIFGSIRRKKSGSDEKA